MQALWAVGLALLGCAVAGAQEGGGVIASQRAFIERWLSEANAPRSSAAERAAAADFLMNELAARGLPAERRPYRAANIHPVLDLIMPPFSGENILSPIPATQAGSGWIVLGAHYDSEAGSPGADDNASGVAAVLDVAETLMALPDRRHGVLIAFFDQEEEGKIGSAALVRQWLAEGLDIRSMHSVDMAGWDADGDGAVELDAPDDDWFALYARHAAPLGIELLRAHYDSSDHVSFRAAGIDALCLGEAFQRRDSSPHRHRPGDVAETINYPYLARNTALMRSVLVELVSREAEE